MNTYLFICLHTFNILGQILQHTYILQYINELYMIDLDKICIYTSYCKYDDNIIIIYNNLQQQLQI